MPVKKDSDNWFGDHILVRKSSVQNTQIPSVTLRSNSVQCLMEGSGGRGLCSYSAFSSCVTCGSSIGSPCSGFFIYNKENNNNNRNGKQSSEQAG